MCAVTDKPLTLAEQNKVLREALQKYVDWSAAEENHGDTTFWQRVEMYREAENSARAALALSEVDASALTGQIEAMKEVLELVRNGLVWYHDMFPETVSDVDYEMLQEIDKHLGSKPTEGDENE